MKKKQLALQNWKKLINFLILQKHINPKKNPYSRWGIQMLANQLESHNSLGNLPKKQGKKRKN